MGTAAVRRIEGNHFTVAPGRFETPVPGRDARVHRFPVRPPFPRPEAGHTAYRRPVSAPVSCADRTRPAALPFAAAARQTVLTVLLTALALIAILGVAHLRTSQVAADVPRTDVAVVRIGESLADVAARIAPEAAAAQVVERIVELNVLSGTTVRPGQQLIVPVIGRG
ncbi:LysM peptidoglycan-binding domain-containing protein [Rhodococcus phenolicus]|uniref:LysM peptidoglycan-binding domain-containing protein n=1 Tax=Rhodococcus phenolicus TaxID=263849 RepID=UPI000A4B3115|nr:LysM peptidoglycan-binding domain-containing protein [Rhodococcus phenolicus]